MMFPLVSFEQVNLAAANGCLERWGHKMGPLLRAHGTGYALRADAQRRAGRNRDDVIADP